MSWTRELGMLRRELVDVVIPSAIARLFVWTLTANTSALGKEDQVQTADDDVSKGQRPVRRTEPFGLRSRVPAKQRSLSLRLGSSTVIYLGVASDGGYGPGDLEDGETAVYSKNVEKALHAKDSGDVALASKAGQVVSVNGDDHQMLKTTDFYADLATWIGQVDVVIKALIAPIGIAVPAKAVYTAYAALPTSLVVKVATPTNYKSDKAKNG